MMKRTRTTSLDFGWFWRAAWSRLYRRLEAAALLRAVSTGAMVLWVVALLALCLLLSDM